MKINLIAFGIAKDILQSKQLTIELPPGGTISTLKAHLYKQYPDFSGLKSIAFAVGENYQEEGYALHENDEVVIIPPVAGG